MVQPQAQTGSTLQWEMAGGDGVGSGGQGSLRVPPELAENEVVSRLFTDNHQLRGTVLSIKTSAKKTYSFISLQIFMPSFKCSLYCSFHPLRRCLEKE